MHRLPVTSRTYPGGHSHRKLPSVLTHSPPSHAPGMMAHSFRSVPDSPLPGPMGQSDEKSAAIGGRIKFIKLPSKS